MTLPDWIAAHGLGFACHKMSLKIYRCRITCEDRGMDVFHISSTEPTLAEVITRLAKAARQHVNSKLPSVPKLNASRDEASFRHWCALYGYNPASHKAHERYLTIRRRAEQFKYVVGIPAYKELLEIIWE